MKKSYEIVSNKMYEYLDIYKIYENHIKSYMICSFLSEQYKTNFQVEKDSIDIDALDNWEKNKKLFVFN